MTTKLTLTIEESVIDAAKQYAQEKGKSLSSIVENYLKSVSTKKKNPTQLSPEVGKLIGVIQLPENFDYKSVLSTAITRKHTP